MTLVDLLTIAALAVGAVGSLAIVLIGMSAGETDRD